VGRSGRAPLYPLAFPDLVTQGDVFALSQASYLVWRHLFDGQIALVERMSDAYHLNVRGDDVVVGYLLEIVHRR
jgi:hypothetical protein